MTNCRGCAVPGSGLSAISIGDFRPVHLHSRTAIEKRCEFLPLSRNPGAIWKTHAPELRHYAGPTSPARSTLDRCLTRQWTTTVQPKTLGNNRLAIARCNTGTTKPVFSPNLSQQAHDGCHPTDTLKLSATAGRKTVRMDCRSGSLGSGLAKAIAVPRRATGRRMMADGAICTAE